MQPLFRMNLSNPLKKSSEYLEVLRKVDYPRLYLQFDRYKEMLSPENPKPLEGRIRRILRLHNKELRTLHYCSYLHPREYSQSENSAQNWYDIEDHRRRLWKGLPLYHDRTGHLKTHVLQQHSFVRKIKRADPSFKIGEESIVRYEQFMTLIKKHTNRECSN